MCGVCESQALLDDADDHAADDVDENDQQAGDSVAAHEFGCTVHGTEEPAFVFQHLTAPARFLLIDRAGGHFGVDRHLLARHRIEMEAGGDFRDAARTFGDDHEIHDDQNREYDDADHEVAAHHKIAEGLDDVAGSVGSFVSVREDEACRCKVERQPQHRRDQQHGREGGKFQRRVDEQCRHQDQHREDDRYCQREVEQQRRQRQDQNDQDGEDADGKRDVATLEEGADISEAWQLDAADVGGRGGGDVAHA